MQYAYGCVERTKGINEDDDKYREWMSRQTHVHTTHSVCHGKSKNLG